jgi:endonuclease YncB( thermonuclease family)
MLACALMVLLSGIAIAAIDETYGVVTKVVDGDTFYVAIQKADPRIISSVEDIRLADVNSPEMSTSEGPAARDFTYAVLMGKRVYLDIDDLKVRDEYGRLVCVVYLSGAYGQPLATPCFNRMLVDSGHAVIDNFTDNEFDPKNWWSGTKQGTVLIPAEGQLRDLLSPLQQSAEKEINKGAKNALSWLGSQISNQIPLQGT